jgi:hypothetical protein
MASNRVQLPQRNREPGISGHVATLEFSRVDLNRGLAVFLLQPADGTAAPEILIPLSQIRPNTVEDQSEVWRSLVAALFDWFRDQGAYPSFVRGFEVQTGDDSTGDPALYVKILLKAAPGVADNDTVLRWNNFADRVQDYLSQLKLQRWPYVRLGEWRRKR